MTHRSEWKPARVLKTPTDVSSHDWMENPAHSNHMDELKHSVGEVTLQHPNSWLTNVGGRPQGLDRNRQKERVLHATMTNYHLFWSTMVSEDVASLDSMEQTGGPHPNKSWCERWDGVANTHLQQSVTSFANDLLENAGEVRDETLANYLSNISHTINISLPIRAHLRSRINRSGMFLTKMNAPSFIPPLALTTLSRCV